MALTPATIRLDLKCGKGSISEGEKCHKGSATKSEQMQRRKGKAAGRLMTAVGYTAFGAGMLHANNVLERTKNNPMQPVNHSLGRGWLAAGAGLGLVAAGHQMQANNETNERRRKHALGQRNVQGTIGLLAAGYGAAKLLGPAHHLKPHHFGLAPEPLPGAERRNFFGGLSARTGQALTQRASRKALERVYKGPTGRRGDSIWATGFSPESGEE